MLRNLVFTISASSVLFSRARYLRATGSQESYVRRAFPLYSQQALMELFVGTGTIHAVDEVWIPPPTLPSLARVIAEHGAVLLQ